MPELPEVETICRQLKRHLEGGLITRLRLARPDILRGAPERALASVLGRRIEKVSRRGKLVRLGLSGGRLLVFHLKMTGRLVVGPERRPDKHNHLLVTVGGAGGACQLHFDDPRRFGRIWLLPSAGAEEMPPFLNLGPDALAVTRPDLAARLGASSRRLKPLLLDQKIVAGLGNIYADEILHRTGIHPLTRGRDLTAAKAAALWRNMRLVLRHAIRRGGSSVRDYVDPSGRRGSFQLEHAVYRREGLPCPRCPGTVRRIVVGGRGTYFCPRCQRPPPCGVTGRRAGGLTKGCP